VVYLPVIIQLIGAGKDTFFMTGIRAGVELDGWALSYQCLGELRLDEFPGVHSVAEFLTCRTCVCLQISVLSVSLMVESDVI
jgi:hypothetical protein